MFFLGKRGFEMSDPEKTVILEDGAFDPDFGNCPVCGIKLSPDAENAEFLRCPACRYVKRIKTVVEPGNIVANKYRVLSHLKSGGCGSIFLCCPLADQSRRYVLKVLKQAGGTGKKRFRREAQILASIENNDRIARIMDYWESGNDTYIVMEFIVGKNLREFLTDYVFDELSTLQIGCEAARALQDIWEQYAIIHRDIKPENIMLNDEWHLKLLDFGLSKQCDDVMASMITMEQSSLGTPGYMSPEHFTDFKNTDFRSDIYSLGATLFTVLTGEKASDGETVAEYYSATLANSPPAEERFKDKCTPGCMRLIRKMMAAKPEDRHSSYQELLAELEELIRNISD